MKAFVIFLVLVVTVLALWWLPPPPPPPPPPPDPTPNPVPPSPKTNANVSTGTRGLNVIALAQENYSVSRGGAGMEDFSPEFGALTNKMDWQWVSALVQGAKRTNHLEGYQFELMAHPVGGFRSNYLAIAKPAAGFFGPELWVDKRRVVWTNETTGKQ